jgi:hypothetical protein
LPGVLRAGIRRTSCGDSWVIRTGVHDATFTLFDNDRRFLFATSYDTDWDSYLEDAVTIVGADKWYAVLQHCEEVPEGRTDNPPNAEEVKKILEATRETALYYTRAYPEGTIAEIMKAQRLQEAFDQALDHPDAGEALAHPALKPLLALTGKSRLHLPPTSTKMPAQLRPLAKLGVDLGPSAEVPTGPGSWAVPAIFIPTDRPRSGQPN